MSKAHLKINQKFEKMVKKMENLDNFFRKYNGSYYFFIAIILAVCTVIISIILYIQIDPTFTIVTHYISHLGSTPVGAQEGKLYPSAVVFNTGFAILVIFRILLILFLARYLQIKGAPKKLTIIGIILALFSSSGSLIVAVVPFSVSLSIHMLGALILFIGTIFSGSMFTTIELKTPNIPRYLPVIIFINVVVYLIFATLLIGESINFAPDGSSVIWEWFAFLSSLLWLFVHGVYTYKNPVFLSKN